jgi:sodium transport system permease protein
MILPLFLIVYAISSPMAAAIDLGAGEKERGTLEPLLTTQVSRMRLLFGKMFAITLMGLIGTIASMIGLAVSFKVSGDVFGGASLVLSPKAYLFVGLCALLLTMIFGAIELSISIYARSFKEAQTYLSPLTILGMVAAFGTYMMDVKNAPLAYFNIPIANMSLIMKEFILGIFNPVHIVITFGWMAIYLVTVMVFARYMFTREDVIFRT